MLHSIFRRGDILKYLTKRDFCAGLLMMLVGLFFALNGPSYRTGTLMHMGPGFMPTALGVLLLLLGIAIAGTAFTGSDEADARIMPDHPQWWGWFCILAGPALFILFASYGGLAPATFACVFVSSLGDKSATWKGSFILALVITIFGVALFSYALKVPMPVLEWRGL
jgi:Tripartite tricarboxylate transporter TctB family